MEVKRRRELDKQGSASAGDNLKSFFKKNKKDQDPEMAKASNTLLKKIMGEQKCLIAVALPLSFLGTIQNFATSHFIGKTIDAMDKAVKGGADWNEFDELLYQWAVIVAAGACFAGLRDWLYALSGEKIGESIRGRFFDSIIRKDCAFFDDHKEGDIRK